MPRMPPPPALDVYKRQALLLALIGLFTVLGWIVGLVRSALDDSGLRKAYRDRLYGMVMLDPVAFDDVNSVDPGVFKQAAIWGTVYQVQNSGGSLDQYERCLLYTSARPPLSRWMSMSWTSPTARPPSTKMCIRDRQMLGRSLWPPTL